MIKLHHLKIGRSIFTLWLLEELGIDYELEIYHRDANTFRAPPELTGPHPLGKSPVIEDDGFVLAESGAIAAYLIDTYGKDSGLAPDRSDKTAYANYLHWLHYPEGSGVMPFMMLMVGGNPASGDGGEALKTFALPEAEKQIRYIASALDGQDYIMGDELSGADIGLACVCAMGSNMGFIDNPVIAAYVARCMGRPAFARALEKEAD